MKLKEILSKSGVCGDLESQNKDGVLKELSQLAQTVESSLSADMIYKVLIEREKLGSTGVGNGVAIPHGKVKGLDRVVTLFGRSKKGIDFKSHDHKPAYLFFVVLAPENVVGLHLQALARLSRLLKVEALRDRLNQSKDDGLYEIIIGEDEKI